MGVYKLVSIDPFRTLDDLKLKTLSWVHSFHHQRLHSSIDT